MSSQGQLADTESVSDPHPSLWVVALLFFGVGDLVTTVVGLRLTGARELSPLVSLLSGVGLYVTLVGAKLVVFGLCYLLWRVVPRPHCVGAPLALAGLGVGVTLWNVMVVAKVVLF